MSRTACAQTEMVRAGLDALLLTTEPEVRYYTGFLTRFWESPTRPWFVVLPVSGAPVAIIPAIGAPLMARTWVKDVRTWPAPRPEDDGIGLLARTLGELTPANGRIGLAEGHESHLQMPLAGLAALRDQLGLRTIVDDRGITRRLRQVKSPAEVDKIRFAAKIADRAFGRLSSIASPGDPISLVFRRFQMLCLEEGADWVPYLAGACAPGGYEDVISPADERPLQLGDVLMLDTGLVHDGYFCDFDRNYSLGPPSNAVASAHARLIEATEAAATAVRPGETMAGLYRLMADRLQLTAGSGRLGHGVGQQLTEGASILPDDHTELVAGMVIALEPMINLAPGKIMVHEENITVTENAYEWLSSPQKPQIRVLA